MTRPAAKLHNDRTASGRGRLWALAVLLLAAAYAVVSGMVKRQLTQTEERP